MFFNAFDQTINIYPLCVVLKANKLLSFTIIVCLQLCWQTNKIELLMMIPNTCDAFVPVNIGIINNYYELT